MNFCKYFVFLFLFFIFSDCSLYTKQIKIQSLGTKSCKLKVLPELGNTISYFGTNEKNVLFFPIPEKDYKSDSRLLGIPFLFPWVNRLESKIVHWEKKGQSYQLAPDSILRLDKNGLPIHGLVLKSEDWKVVEIQNQEKFAKIKSRLEIRDDSSLKIFPYSYQLEIEYILEDKNESKGNFCELTVLVHLLNTGNKNMPLSFGFHPYFQKQSPYSIQNSSSRYWEMNELKLPTGKLLDRKETDNLQELDHVFTKFTGSDFGFDFKDYKIRIKQDQNFDNMVIFTPSGKDFVCMEPMTSPTNAFGLQNKNKYNLKLMKPGEYRVFQFSIQMIESK